VSLFQKPVFCHTARATVSAEKADMTAGQPAINKNNNVDLQLFMIFNNIITK
jgi:hypothetical protein